MAKCESCGKETDTVYLCMTNGKLKNLCESCIVKIKLAYEL